MASLKQENFWRFLAAGWLATKFFDRRRRFCTFSGAGKTTLLNVLTQRNLDGIEVLGNVKLNGTPVTRHTIRRIAAFCQQTDLVSGGRDCKRCKRRPL